jgi:hypothetical protein
MGYFDEIADASEYVRNGREDVLGEAIYCQFINVRHTLTLTRYLARATKLSKKD